MPTLIHALNSIVSTPTDDKQAAAAIKKLINSPTPSISYTAQTMPSDTESHLSPLSNAARQGKTNCVQALMHTSLYHSHKHLLESGVRALKYAIQHNHPGCIAAITNAIDSTSHQSSPENPGFLHTKVVRVKKNEYALYDQGYSINLSPLLNLCITHDNGECLHALINAILPYPMTAQDRIKHIANNESLTKLLKPALYTALRNNATSCINAINAAGINHCFYSKYIFALSQSSVSARQRIFNTIPKPWLTDLLHTPRLPAKHIKFLIQHGAQLNFGKPKAVAAIIKTLIRNNDTQTLMQLYNQGADFKHPDKDGITPAYHAQLHYLANGDSRCMKLLFNMGATNAERHNNLTPLQHINSMSALHTSYNAELFKRFGGETAAPTTRNHSVTAPIKKLPASRYTLLSLRDMRNRADASNGNVGATARATPTPPSSSHDLHS